MKTKEYPAMDGFYWFRENENAAFQIVKVSGSNHYSIGSQWAGNVRKTQWIGPLVPDELEVYVSKTK